MILSQSLKLKINLHNLVVVPEDGIGMKLLSGIKPKHVPHLTPTSPIFVYICLYQIRLPSSVPQELEIELIPRWPCPILCAHLHFSHFNIKQVVEDLSNKIFKTQSIMNIGREKCFICYNISRKTDIISCDYTS